MIIAIAIKIGAGLFLLIACYSPIKAGCWDLGAYPWQNCLWLWGRPGWLTWGKMEYKRSHTFKWGVMWKSEREKPTALVDFTWNINLPLPSPSVSTFLGSHIGCALSFSCCSWPLWHTKGKSTCSSPKILQKLGQLPFWSHKAVLILMPCVCPCWEILLCCLQQRLRGDNNRRHTKGVFVQLAPCPADTMRLGPGNMHSSLMRAWASSIIRVGWASSHPAFWLDRGSSVGCGILDVGDARGGAASSPFQEWDKLPMYSRKRSAEHLQHLCSLFQSFKPPDNANTRPKSPKLVAANLGADGMIGGLTYSHPLLRAEWGRSVPDHPMCCTTHKEDHRSRMGLLYTWCSWYFTSESGSL